MQQAAAVGDVVCACAGGRGTAEISYNKIVKRMFLYKKQI